MKDLKFYLLIASVICSTVAMSQHRQSELGRLLHGKTKLNEIIKIVSDYYTPKIITQNGTDQNFRRLRTWHRWALYMSNRLDADGNITEVSKRNEQALQQLGTGNRMDGISSSAGAWGFIGPSSVNNPNINLGIGRCDRIAFHPTDPNILFVGTPNGGLWKSINDGASWFCLTNNLANQSVSGVVVDYANPSIIYILTGAGDNDINDDGIEALGYMRRGSGVYKTTDGGANWSVTGPIPTNNSYSGLRLVQDPNDHNILLAATTDGIYRTINGGNSWTSVSPFETFDIEYAPNNSGRVYASRHSAIIYSTNSGLTWTPATLSGGMLQDFGRFELAVSPNNASYVYALGGNSNSDGTFSGLYKSTNYGVTFIEQSHTPNILSSGIAGDDDGGQGMYDLALAVSPTDATRIFTGGVNIWTSTNGGTSLTNIMFDGNNARKIHPDFHEMKFSPLNGALYAVNDGGVYKSTNNGGTWTKVSNGLAVAQIYHLTGIDADANILMSGVQDDGIKSRTTAVNSFNQNATGDGFAVALRHNANTAGNDSGLVSLNTSVYRISLNGNVGASPLSHGGEWFPTVAMYTTGANYLYAGFSSVYRSSNGINWVNKSGNGSWCMATCPSNALRVYTAGGSHWYGNDPNGDLRRSDNAGDSWGVKFTSANAAFSKITDIGVNPSNSAYVWLTLGGFDNALKVFKSIDAGESWTNVSPGLPNVPVNCIAVDASNNAYIGTDIGVFYWSNSQSTWLPFYNGMPVVPVTDLVINAAANVIRASTFGRGIYSSDLYSTCSSVLALNTAYAGNSFYEASSSISSTGSILGGPDTHVFFKAGSSISFTEGFNVAEGNEFKAYLGACGIGMPTMKAVGQNISMPDYHFTLSSTIAVTGVSATGCDLKIECTKSANLKVVIVDENNVVVKEDVVTPSQKITNRHIDLSFTAGKIYKAILFEDGVEAHWQEIIK